MINLKGFIVGNGATDWTFDVMPSFPELVKYFNLIPDSIYQNYVDHGCTLFFNGTMKFDADKGTEQDCIDIWGQIEDLTDKLNWYDLYRKKFGLGVSKKTHDIWGRPLENPRVGKTNLKDGTEVTYPRGFSFSEYVGAWLKHHPGTKASAAKDDNLLGDAVSDYFNNQAIKDILKIDDSLYFEGKSTWIQCNN